VSGPYQTQREATDAVRHITGGPAGSWDEASRQLLEDARAAAGVELGAYDRQILAWASTWEPWVCAVIAGIIRRAGKAGQP
jgi:hypothetical protein